MIHVSPVIFDTAHSNVTKKSFIKVAMVRYSCLVIFYFEKKFCVLARIGETCVTIICRRPCRKNYISGYIWHRSFIHTVKCSFFDEKFVYQSFYDAPFTFSYFLLQGKVLFHTRQQVALRDVYLSKAFGAPCRKKIISGCFWLKLFIQKGKMLFL